MNQQAQKSANELAAQGINAGVAGQNAGTNQANALAHSVWGQYRLRCSRGARRWRRRRERFWE